MTLSEFITYCKLKGYVTSHKELDKPGWDVEADYHYEIQLQGRGYTSTITYATIGEGAAMMSCRLSEHTTNGILIAGAPELGDIKEAFIPS